MRSLFSVYVPNLDGLITIDEAQLALGLTDGDYREADLQRMIDRISASIARACKIRTDGTNPPTLLTEDITETFRLDGGSYSVWRNVRICDWSAPPPLQLSRRRVTAVASVNEGETLLDPLFYEFDGAAGLLYRLDGDPVRWSATPITVAYSAGFVTVPDDLKLAAETWLRLLWRDAYQTPTVVTDSRLLREEVPGVLSRTWSAQIMQDQSLLPPEVRAMLIGGGYIETWVA